MKTFTKNDPRFKELLAKTQHDEPVFLLAGRDAQMPTLVWLWAALRELKDEPKEIVSEARDVVVAAINWQHQRGTKAEGLGASTLCGVLELIRQANASRKVIAENEPTRDELVRQMLAHTTIAPEDTEEVKK